MSLDLNSESAASPNLSRPNRLGAETSPYLRQHAYNPVDWYSWGEEALTRARAEDRPILLSVGYSACHWCHVMERECFENDQIAGLMNECFVNIKVDREERPDLDEIYMVAVQAMTGSGGWPMTVFLTPDQRPFYGGTYFPPTDRYGRPGFPKVLAAVAEFYGNHRDQAHQQASRLTEALRQNTVLPAGGAGLGVELIENACRQFKNNFDQAHGGFGQAPKFPASMSLALLLRHHRHSGDQEALEVVETSLKKMAHGGIYDQLGGGFHRYSVDEHWLVPHFEKMLYDNGLLTWVYLEAYQLTGDSSYRQVVEETLGYVLREMTAPGGGFYAAQDADSEGEEGKFFAWDPEQVAAVLGEDQARLFNRYYGISEEGNFEQGKSVLHVADPLEGVARLLQVTAEELRHAIAEGRQRLLRVRQQRIAPGLDDKIIVSWNGLMISAMARASQVLGDTAYLEAASASATFILEQMTEGEQLRHTYGGGQARLEAYQDDYAALTNALLDLYEATFDRRWLQVARRWCTAMIERFWDDKEGGFFFTAGTAEALIVRTKSPHDNPTPSGNALGALVLLRLGEMTGDGELRAKAERTLQLFGGLMRQVPSASAQMLCALDFYLSPPCQIAVVGPGTEQLLKVVWGHFLPAKVVVGVGAGDDPDEVVRDIPLLAGKIPAHMGRASAYLCRNFTCSPPVGESEVLNAMLSAQV
ncbi:MAG: thioredoxin domain-containing protein [Candidatus Latescibacteria bacterium]|nr:thioredoxin domain-containing protein [Candidatus Latescibacterota bacterium]